MLFNEIKKDKVKLKKYLSKWKKIIKPNLRNKYFKRHDLFFKDSNYREYVYDNFENNKKFCLKQLSYDFKEKSILIICLKIEWRMNFFMKMCLFLCIVRT